MTSQPSKVTSIEGDNFTEIYYDLVNQIRSRGTLEGKTRDLILTSFTLNDPTKSLLLYSKNWRWAYQELLDRAASWLHPDEPLLFNPGRAVKYRSNWAKKLEKEGGEFDYAYGEYFYDQVPAVIQNLKKQRTSREAILTVWNKEYLVNQESYARRPCTLNLHFFIREKHLYCVAYMRSNDIINLLPYDVFHHTFIHRYVAYCLNLPLGSYTHISSHSYYPKRRELNDRNYFGPWDESMQISLAHADLHEPEEFGPDFLQELSKAVKFEELGMSPSDFKSPFLIKLISHIQGDSKFYL